MLLMVSHSHGGIAGSARRCPTRAPDELKAGGQGFRRIGDELALNKTAPEVAEGVGKRREVVDGDFIYESWDEEHSAGQLEDDDDEGCLGQARPDDFLGLSELIGGDNELVTSFNEDDSAEVVRQLAEEVEGLVCHEPEPEPQPAASGSLNVIQPKKTDHTKRPAAQPRRKVAKAPDGESTAGEISMTESISEEEVDKRQNLKNALLKRIQGRIRIMEENEASLEAGRRAE